MKKSVLLSICFFVILSFTHVFAQAPAAINYQAVARDAQGNVMSNKQMNIKFLLRSQAGISYYTESQLLTTNQYGIYTAKVGRGIVLNGSFASVPWSSGNIWMDIAIDLNGGNNFANAGSSELLSVPYALYSDKSGTSGPAGPAGPTGMAGPTGLTGAAGPQGQAGPAGPAGNNGAAGPIGATGPAGSAGLNGAAGPTGPTGANGLAGNNGLPGSAGPTGPTGSTGFAGPTGATGPAGATGPQGQNGLNGGSGPAGAAGAPGSVGPTGPTGPSAALSAWSLTGNSGTTPSSAFLGTSDAADLSIKTNNQERIRIAVSGNIGIGNSSPDASALMDLTSSTQGFLLPRLSDSQRNAIANPAIGLQIFNTNSNCINIYKPNGWFEFCGNCIPPATPQVTNNGPICAGDSLVLTAANIAGATYQWTGPNGFVSSNQNPHILNAQVSASGVYSVIATVNGCSSSVSSTNVLVNALPASSFVSLPVSPDTSQTVTFTPSVSGAVYSWSFQGGSPSSSTIEVPAVRWYTAGDYVVSLVVTQNSCTSVVQVDTIHVSTYTTGSQIFTSSGTFSVPSGVSSVRVLVVGGGAGGGGGHTGGGGSGYVRVGAFSVSGNIAVTVGTGGSRGIGGPSANWNGGSGAGNTSSFGALLSASGASSVSANCCGGNGGSGGGGGGNGGCGGNGGSGGSNGFQCSTEVGGSGGNFDPLVGFSVSTLSAGNGGAGGSTSHGGGGGAGGVLVNGNGPNAGDGANLQSGKGGSGYGAGGGGGGYDGSYYDGGDGANGVVYIEW